MITHLSVLNFKGFKEATIEPRLITVLIGPNGSGKSSLLQALLLLKQSTNRTALEPAKQIINLGEMKDLLFKQLGSAEHLTIAIGGDSYVDRAPDYPLGNIVKYDCQVQCDASGRVARQQGEFDFDLEGDRCQVSLHTDEKERIVNFLDLAISFEPNFTVGFPILIRSITESTKSLERKGVQRAVVEQALNVALHSIVNDLDSLVWVPPSRGMYQPYYPFGFKFSREVTPAQGVDPFYQQMATNLEYERERQEDISQLMRRVTGVSIFTRTLPERMVETLASRTGRTPVNIVNEGFGTNQLTHLLYAVVSASPHSTILIEEPETHLHPRAQVDLAAALVEHSREKSKQLIFTTHSEHILHRLLTLVARGELSPGELAIYACEKGEDGQPQPPHLLPVDERGRIAGGLRGFFEVDLEELDEYFKALEKRQTG